MFSKTSVVAVEDAAEHIQTFVLIAAAAIGGQLAPHFLKSHALNNHPAGPPQSRQKQAFAAKQRRPDAAYQLDIVVYPFIKGNDAAGIDLQHFASLELELDEISPGMDEDLARA